MNGIELFEKLYNDEIGEAQCIYVKHPDEEPNQHFILRNLWGKFDNEELLRNLLFKEYTFELKNQQEIKKILKEKERKEEITRLEQKLERLKKEDE